MPVKSIAYLQGENILRPQRPREGLQRKSFCRLRKHRAGGQMQFRQKIAAESPTAAFEIKIRAAFGCKAKVYNAGGTPKKKSRSNGIFIFIVSAWRRHRSRNCIFP